MTPLLWITLAIAALTGCSDRDPAKTQARTRPPPRQIQDPPSKHVRLRPPYAIRADGVGPYSLGAKIASLMAQLPSGPRIARFEIPGVVRTSVVRAEDDAILIGGETGGTATLVAVVGRDVARTEANVHVGSSVDELVQALGPLADEPDRARDPRLAAPSKLPSTRVVVDREQGRVVAIVVTAAPPAMRPAGPSSEAECKRPPGTAKMFGICLTSGGEVVEIEDDELILRPADSDRTIATRRIPNLVFAVPLRNVAEGHDELIAITRSDDNQQRSWSIVGYRLDAKQLVPVVDPEVLYQLSSAQARWIGSDLREVELYLELASRSDGIEVGGLLTTRTGAKIRDVAEISSRLVARRHGKSMAAEPVDAGLGDARAPTAGAAPDRP